MDRVNGLQKIATILKTISFGSRVYTFLCSIYTYVAVQGMTIGADYYISFSGHIISITHTCQLRWITPQKHILALFKMSF